MHNTMWIECQKTILSIMLLSAKAFVEGASLVTNSSLACYDCSEAFKYVWEPYTECQTFPKLSPLRNCLEEERYCMVERVSFKSMTVSITRSCTRECWHGCYASGFGFTKLKCTSCCLTPGCNVGNGAISRNTEVPIGGTLLLLLLYNMCSYCSWLNV